MALKNITLSRDNFHLGLKPLSIDLIFSIEETWLPVIFDVSKNQIHPQRIKFAPTEFIPKTTHSLSSTLRVSFIIPITIWTCFIDLLTLDGLYPPPEWKLPESFTLSTSIVKSLALQIGLDYGRCSINRSEMTE